MGFGLPAAIGAKIANPDKDVVCISGDGGLQMNIQELATSVVQGAGVTICVLNNYYLGMVRQMQQLFYGKRYSATCLRRRKGCPDECKGPNEACPPYTPDFLKLVEAMVDTESAWKRKRISMQPLQRPRNIRMYL